MPHLLRGGRKVPTDWTVHRFSFSSIPILITIETQTTSMNIEQNCRLAIEISILYTRSVTVIAGALVTLEGNELSQKILDGQTRSGKARAPL